MPAYLLELFCCRACNVRERFRSECDDHLRSYLFDLCKKVGAAGEPLGLVGGANIERFAFDSVSVEDAV